MLAYVSLPTLAFYGILWKGILNYLLSLRRFLSNRVVPPFNPFLTSSAYEQVSY